MLYRVLKGCNKQKALFIVYYFVVQVRGPAQQICSQDKLFQFETLSDRKWLHRVEIGEYSLPVWAGTWKIMNFPFRQQKKDWDNDWPTYQQRPRDASHRLHRISGQEAEVRILLEVLFPAVRSDRFCLTWVSRSLQAGRSPGSCPTSPRTRRTSRSTMSRSQDGGGPAGCPQLLLRRTRSVRGAGAAAGASASRSGVLV